MCIFGLEKQLFRQKETIDHEFSLKSIDDSRYWGLDTRDFSILWKHSRSRLSRKSIVDKKDKKKKKKTTVLRWFSSIVPYTPCCLSQYQTPKYWNVGGLATDVSTIIKVTNVHDIVGFPYFNRNNTLLALASLQWIITWNHIQNVLRFRRIAMAKI